MNAFAVVAIGASQGGVEALQVIVQELENDLPAAILIVLHVGRGPSYLPSILSRRAHMQAKHAENGEALRPGRIYIAPADHHMMIDGDSLSLSRGPRENWTRPAIDPLFRSAATSFGARVIGTVLTGRLNDGAAGLYQIRQAGGVGIVQHPADAAFPEMPSSALRYAGADHSVPLAAIPALISELAHEIAYSGEAQTSLAGGRPHG